MMETDVALAGVESYRQLIFDCDGVIVDSNAVKEANIRSAALSVCDPGEADRFVAYFVGNNGVARERKIAGFFPSPATRRAILAEYNRLNATTIPLIEPEPVTRRFLDRCARAGIPLYVLSGGDEDEVRQMLDNAGIAGLFRDIMGGPLSKMEHLQRLGLTGPTCYFGDSQYDYEVASQFEYDFVFLSRHSQFTGWREFFAQRPAVRVVADFHAFVP
jgi:phosphoglycolate phosphatase-like HAD superfamily hydrolase